MKKVFYVSPFFKVEGKYKISFSINRHFVNLFISLRIKKKKKVFEASFKGKAMNISEVNLLKVFFVKIITKSESYFWNLLSSIEIIFKRSILYTKTY